MPTDMHTGKTRRVRFEWERALGKSHLPPGARAVGRALAEFSNGTTGGNCHPGGERLAESLGVNRRTITRNLAILRDEGWIERTARGGAGPGRGHVGKSGTADTYRLVIPAARRHQDVPGCRYCREAHAQPGSLNDSVNDSRDLKHGTFSTETLDIPAENMGHDAPLSVSATSKEEHSALLVRPQRASRCGRDTIQLTSDPADISAVEDEIDAALHLNIGERSTVDGMLQRGAHLRAAINKILKDRAEALDADMLRPPACASRGRRVDDDNWPVAPTSLRVELDGFPPSHRRSTTDDRVRMALEAGEQAQAILDARANAALSDETWRSLPAGARRPAPGWPDDDQPAIGARLDGIIMDLTARITRPRPSALVGRPEYADSESWADPEAWAATAATAG